MQSISDVKSMVNQLKPLQQEQNALTLHSNIVGRLQNFTNSDAFQLRIDAEQSKLITIATINI